MSKTHPDKYWLYEAAVQSPEVHLYWFNRIFHDLFGKTAHRLREDFCGTFVLAKEWVLAHPKNTALALDLDDEPLDYGRKIHFKTLPPAARRRLKIHQKNVLSTTVPKSDLIVACNFSFCIFKDRKTLVEYFKKCLSSLSSPGALILELAGGPGMINQIRERKVVRHEGARFEYTWHQKSFDPISQNGVYAIHFKLQNGTVLKDAFTYDWRLWTIPEVREALLEAGFDETAVYWETEHKGKPTGEFIHTEKGDNAFAWITYVAALKKT